MHLPAKKGGFFNKVYVARRGLQAENITDLRGCTAKKVGDCSDKEEEEEALHP